MLTQKQLARSTGAALLVMAALSGVAYGVIHGMFYVAQNPQATIIALQKYSSLLWLELGIWALIAILDVVVSIAVFLLYKSANQALACASMVFRLVYTGFLIVASIVLSNAFFAGAKAYDRFVQFEQVWTMGLVLFGIHLVLLGILGLRSTTPKLVSFLLIVGGSCYFGIHILKVFPGAATSLAGVLEPFFVLPMALSELVLAFWLLFRKKTTLDPA
jgi:hypothetical protein